MSIWNKEQAQERRRSSYSTIFSSSESEGDEEEISLECYLDVNEESEVTSSDNGKVIFVDKDGFIFEGTLKDGKKFGLGTTYKNHGHRDINWFVDNKPKSHGVRLNEDNTQAWRLYDGIKHSLISRKSALKIIKSIENQQKRFDHSVYEVVW